MKTSHEVRYRPASAMAEIDAGTIHLVITSPPYPMIEMWDDAFSSQNSKIRVALDGADGKRAFELMHELLDEVWQAVHRVLVPGGLACINIGDATRTIGKDFQLFPSHARVISAFSSLGFQSLPEILWRKQTNAPNKFMGSGMLPAGAYVTLEHEFILVFRKGGKREFKGVDADDRRRSAFFWEERNTWFSDVWDFKGTAQTMVPGSARERNAAFPFELAFRLVNMFSLQSDNVLDPFLGTGTTMLAAMAAGRNSIGYEIDPSMRVTIDARVDNIVPFSNELLDKRLQAHVDFVGQHLAKGKEIKHESVQYGFPVITNQEIEVLLPRMRGIARIAEDTYEATYRA